MLSAKGQPAEVLRACRDGRFELVISEALLEELQRPLAYPKLRKHIPREKAAGYINWVRDHGTFAEDPTSEPSVSSVIPMMTICSPSQSTDGPTSSPATEICSPRRGSPHTHTKAVSGRARGTALRTTLSPANSGPRSSGNDMPMPSSRRRRNSGQRRLRNTEAIVIVASAQSSRSGAWRLRESAPYRPDMWPVRSAL